MKIGVSDLKGRPGEELEFKVQEKWPFLATAAVKIPIVTPVHVSGKVTNTGKTLLVKGQVATTLELTCDRCLDVFRYSILAPLEEEYTATAGLPAANRDVEGREVRPLEGDFINLKTAVEETLILALPMKQLCRENCEGLCPRCGCNLNTGTCRCEKKMVDPRLAVLEELLRNNNDNNDATR